MQFNVTGIYIVSLSAITTVSLIFTFKANKDIHNALVYKDLCWQMVENFNKVEKPYLPFKQKLDLSKSFTLKEYDATIIKLINQADFYKDYYKDKNIIYRNAANSTIEYCDISLNCTGFKESSIKESISKTLKIADSSYTEYILTYSKIKQFIKLAKLEREKLNVKLSQSQQI